MCDSKETVWMNLFAKHYITVTVSISLNHWERDSLLTFSGWKPERNSLGQPDQIQHKTKIPEIMVNNKKTLSLFQWLSTIDSWDETNALEKCATLSACMLAIKDPFVELQEKTKENHMKLCWFGQ